MTMNIPTNYKLISKQLASLIEDEKNLIAILSNTSALLNDTIDHINWVGFYLIENKELILGPFQGHPAGTAVSSGEIQRVKDVHQFPGHIACDANSQSEIVIPLHQNGQIIGVLDIDAPIKNRFSQDDQEGLESIVKTLEKQLNQI
ncbi:GAF domain-containing protein [Staphylococcus epidermidis]|nr:GAF domain-containing protein [Staphylococcus epidermidis]MCG1252607.1 GAF domain-containing protein [Staphylococcus epidermidis]MCG1405420.1 GAF domain-containing protein [Staphylococcus epidermidis]MCG1410009.1 GAF domain-containing protein [Staphylococcus epidermidis]MCG1412062.1 GAF domain-containing protein [Staphylococcus epidermidis]